MKGSRFPPNPLVALFYLFIFAKSESAVKEGTYPNNNPAAESSQVVESLEEKLLPKQHLNKTYANTKGEKKKQQAQTQDRNPNSKCSIQPAVLK